MKMRIRLLIAFFCAHFFATPIAQAQVGFIASGNSLPLAQMIQATARPPAPLPKANCIDKNRAQIVFKGVDVYFCLQKKGEGLELGILSAADDLYSTRQIDITFAIMILANRKLEKFWPAISDSFGNDLQKLRQIELEKLNYNASDTLLSLHRGKQADIINSAITLKKLGYFDEALSLLRKNSNKYPGDKKKLSGKDQWDWISLVLVEASTSYQSGNVDQGIAILSAIENQTLISEEYRVNAAINRASFLAEQGRYAEGIAALDKAESAFLGNEKNTDRAYNISGSNRQFAWIRACLLSGIGKKSEAKEYIDFVLNSPENPVDDFAVAPSTGSIIVRMAFCLNDTQMMADLIRKDYNEGRLFHIGQWLLQPNYRGFYGNNAKFISELMKIEDIQDIVKSVRPLPDSYTPAMNTWRQAGSI